MIYLICFRLVYADCSIFCLQHRPAGGEGIMEERGYLGAEAKVEGMS